MSSIAPFPSRTFGVLLPVSSLWGPEPIGTLGVEAESFVDWLATTGAGIWQILPLTTNGKDESPYFSSSAFATNPWLVDLRQLRDHGLLSDLELPAELSGEQVPFDELRAWKLPLLEAAADLFLNLSDHPWRPGYDRFVVDADWLVDVSHFFALKAHDPHTRWWDWDQPLRRREPEALAGSRRQLVQEIERWQAILFFADRQWSAVRRRANEARILVLGDLPIYVAPDSADVWAHQDQFLLDDSGHLLVQSGVPPDYFSETGQLWGNPIYRWDAMEADGFAWWISRLRRTLQQTDLVRIDHFRALSAYWSVPAADDTASNGAWTTGPGQAFIDALAEAFPDLPLVAEDLGDLDDDVHQLRDRNDLVGMRVLQFGFDDDPPNEHHPSQIVERCIVYPGTHDNETLAGWWSGRTRRQRERVRTATDLPPRLRIRRVVWWLIEVALRSPAVAAVIPVQDLLVLGNEARLNVPGTTQGNWGWRLTESLPDSIAAGLRRAAIGAGRARRT